MKLLILRNIAGTATHWRNSISDLGHEAIVLETFSNRFGFDTDIKIPFLGARACSPSHLFGNIPYEISCWRSCDAVIANYGISTAHDVLPACVTRKPMVVVFHGSDLRRRNLSNNLSKIFTSRYARKTFVSTPDLLRHFDSAELIGRPFKLPEDFREKAVNNPPGSDDLIRVGHFSTNREIKGTANVIRAIDKLRNEGHAFSFEIFENLPHEKVLEKMLEMDIVIDWINRDFGIYGMVSIEAMSLGRAVVCYLDPTLLEYYDIPPPIISPNTADAAGVKNCLQELMAENREQLVRRGLKSIEYVEKVHDPMAQAQRLLSCFD